MGKSTGDGYGSIQQHQRHRYSEDSDSFIDENYLVNGEGEDEHDDANRARLTDDPKSETTTRSRPAAVQLMFVVGVILLIYALARIVGSLLHITPVHFGERDRSRYPSKAMLYEDQIVDHNNQTSTTNTTKTFAQRYYEEIYFFGGPGSPIFVILGGEAPVNRILFPFISTNLAREFNAYTICIEHRFYGDSYPVGKPTTEQLINLLTPSQALSDAVRLIQVKQQELKCGPRGTPSYCPVMTVGTSYAGFLSVLMRMAYPDVIDIGYASSAPLHLYSHSVDPYSYFNKITTVAESVSPGCAQAVLRALDAAQSDIRNGTSGLSFVATKYGLCSKTIPPYITNSSLLSQELIMVIARHFSLDNMGYYPPSSRQNLVRGCRLFQVDGASPAEKVSAYLHLSQDDDECFDLLSELPPGPNATISASDWSGVGSGPEGYMWDFQSCMLNPELGMSNQSMFPPREWTLDFLTRHCQSRFGYTPDLNLLLQEFGIENYTSSTRLLFTNGLQDGWSVASVLNVGNALDIQIINMVNGAHSSDLSYEGPSIHDTEDVKQAHRDIVATMTGWLADIRS